jgi:hypothetical protein
MKRYIFTILFCLFSIEYGLPNFYCSENEKPIFSALVEREGIKHYRIPSFVIRWIIKHSDGSKELLPLLKESRSVNLALVEDGNENNTRVYKRIDEELNESHYVNLASIIDGKSDLTIKSLNSRGSIIELVILISDSDSFVALSITGKINPNTLVNAISKLNRLKG